MPRLYLIPLFLLFFSFGLRAQNEIKQLLDIAQDKYQKGDYIHALSYYDRAMKLDSNSIHILWNYAETLRAYKDYRKAEYYYGKVFEREGTELFPYSLLYYGLMSKHNGKYDQALELFKRAKKVYRKDKRGYLYQKSAKEFESCLWAKNAVTDTSTLVFEHLPFHINTPDAEFGHRVHNNQLVYSSLRGDSVGGKEEIYTEVYKTHLFQAEIEGTIYGKSAKIKDLFWKEYSTGNGSWSPDGKRFYFSLCEDESYNYKCKIMVANYRDGRFKDIDSLGAIINAPGANTTMPFCTMWDGKEVLFFASDKAGGQGGMDIWYSFINNGTQYKEPKNVKRINTLDNELTPFWDQENSTLYFSSTWHDGFGGYDVFKSIFSNGFQAPENVGFPINSPANDLYYFQTNSGDSAYVSSNRLGTNFAKNPTCCSDIFLLRKSVPPPPPTVEESLEELMKRLPVTLYFHNDVPNPRSWATTSDVNYMDSYNEYTEMLETYKKEYSKGLSGSKAEDAKDDIEDFFREFVDQGVKDLFLFRDLLLKELKRGRKIQLTVKGFASPLAKSDYNVNLTKRRIASLINYLNAYNGGVFKPYLNGTADNGGALTIVEIPFGEYTADNFISDNVNDKKNSVFSRAAAKERKIEILSVDVLRQENVTSTLLTANEPIKNFGEVSPGQTLTHTYRLSNTGENTILIDSIIVDLPGVELVYNDNEIAPNEVVTIEIKWNVGENTGKLVGNVFVSYAGLEEKLELVFTAEVK